MSQISWLSPHNLEFPETEQALADPNGLLAVGGDLSPARLERAYRLGIFPWYQEGQPLLWWSPDPRTILRPENLHVSRSMRKFLRQTHFQITIDRDFAAVMRACSEPRDYTDSTWITADMQSAYCELHARGIAHSVEVWDGSDLVGGLYGVALGKVFFGESMFSRRTNASKAAFIRLVERLRASGLELIDCQMPTDHLFSFGAESIPRSEFRALLANLCADGMPDHWPGQFL